jgi:hypothetical protein
MCGGAREKQIEEEKAIEKTTTKAKTLLVQPQSDTIYRILVEH